MSVTTFLDGRPYTQLRGLRAAALSDTGHRLAGTFSDDGGGGGTAVYQNSSTVPCRLTPLTGLEGEQGGRVSDLSDYMVTVPSGTVLTIQDRFLIDGRGTFTITATRERTAEWTTEFEVAKL